MPGVIAVSFQILAARDLAEIEAAAAVELRKLLGVDATWPEPDYQLSQRPVDRARPLSDEDTKRVKLVWDAQVSVQIP